MKPTFLVLCVLASFLQHSAASSDAHGVDDWDEGHVKEFIESHGIDVKSEDLKAQGIDGHALMTDDKAIDNLGLSTEQKLKLTQAIVAKLAEIQKAPVDIFEWRIAHHRLVDFWITPLLICPRVALLWARFMDSNHLIEKANDEIDEIPLTEFWIKWLVAPTYPLYQISQKFNSHTLADDILGFYFMILTFVDVVQFFLAILLLAVGDTRFIVGQASQFVSVFAWVHVSYYLVYWFVPNFISSLWFYFTIYIVLPSFCLVFLCITILFVVGGGFLGVLLSKKSTTKSE